MINIVLTIDVHFEVKKITQPPPSWKHNNHSVIPHVRWHNNLM